MGDPRLNQLRTEIERLRKTIDACCGYMMNAKIDMETNTKKATAICTLDGGLKMARAALAAKSETDAGHRWVKSTLGHGDTMCSACFITNREAAVLGRLDRCEKASLNTEVGP